MTEYLEGEEYTPVCVVCGTPVTWSFYVCSECDEEWGKRKHERPEWLTFLINEERMTRYYIKTGKRVQRIQDSDDGFGYVIDFEDLLETKWDFAGYITAASDGEEGYEFQDSDWESVYSFSI